MDQNLMTIRDVADYLRLSEQTIQRYVLKREIPFRKVKKVIRFRFGEIERWIDEGGGCGSEEAADDMQGGLFADDEAEGGAGGEAGEKAGTAGEGNV